MTHNSSVNFKLINFYFGQKGSHQSPNFDTFECSGKNLPNSSCHFSNHKSGFFFKLCITFQCHERYLLCTFLGQTLNTLHKRNQSKCIFLRLLSVRVKINQILVIFETTNQFFFKFCITLLAHET